MLHEMFESRSNCSNLFPNIYKMLYDTLKRWYIYYIDYINKRWYIYYFNPASCHLLRTLWQKWTSPQQKQIKDNIWKEVNYWKASPFFMAIRECWIDIDDFLHLSH